ncbi:MAG TPA: hypothetical protein VEV17_10235 [Bryobacteraceae bacterium]|nr:hypothetical protein [Bryobacteraceae bacterium]
MSRRDLLKAGAVASGAGFAEGPAAAAGAARTPVTVRDRFWLWGHYEGSHNGDYGLPGNSRITPVEAACYLSVPNVILVRYKGKPEPPFRQYALPFRALREVVWSVVGAGGATASEERSRVLELTRQNPNFSGVMMDDFFRGGKEGKVAALTVGELEALQRRLKTGPRKLDLWVVLYTHQLNDPVGEHLKHCDVVTLWTWKAADLGRLRENFEKAEEVAPAARKVLGCYMWDYGDHKPMPVSSMQLQCKQGLRWLEEDRIDGMIFLASCISDLELETVEWTRGWIQQVGSRKLTAASPAKRGKRK